MLRALRIAVLVLLAGVVGTLFMLWKWGVDDELHQQADQAFVSVRSADAAFSTSLLESRSGLVNHFDDIVRHGKQRRATMKLLRGALPRHIDAADRSDLLHALTELEADVERQDVLVERFKSHHAILRNSVRFLPHVARRLVDAFADHPEGSGVAAELNALFTEVLLFHDFGERYRIPQVRARISKLQDIDRSWLDVTHRKSLKLLERHAATILDEKTEVDELLEAVALTDITTRLIELRRQYHRHHAAALTTTLHLERLLMALGLLLTLALAGAVIVGLTRSARELESAKGGLEEALASLEIEKEKQKELAALKSRFVSMTSHEFRTPLSVILSSTELLEAYGERWAADKRQSHLGRIQAAGNRMKQMLDEVLFIGRSDAGMLKFEPKSVDVRQICRDLVESLRLDHRTTHHIDTTWEGDEPTALADERLLTHILSNLIANAMKYSPEASSVRLDVERHDRELVLRVEDEGIGIPDDDQDRLFESFHRGSNVGHISGTGLGLAIVGRAVELHGGHIDVISVEGKGSTFTVHLPIHDAPAPSLRSEQREHAEAL